LSEATMRKRVKRLAAIFQEAWSFLEDDR